MAECETPPPSCVEPLAWASHIAVSPVKPRVLRDLTVSLLSDADDAWERHRQPWSRAVATGGLGSSKHRGRRAPMRAGVAKTTASTRRREKACRQAANGGPSGRKLSSPASKRSPCLDSGAGPRQFWEAMAGPRLADARWHLDVKVSRYSSRVAWQGREWHTYVDCHKKPWCSFLCRASPAPAVGVGLDWQQSALRARLIAAWAGQQGRLSVKTSIESYSGRMFPSRVYPTGCVGPCPPSC